MTRKVEVFTSDCPLCREALETVRAAACPECKVIERRCAGEACCEEAVRYGIRTVPTVVVDGKIAFEGKPTREEARRLIPVG